jgi:hypothetical protein
MCKCDECTGGTLETFTTQEGAIFDMEGATCPGCGAPSKLAHRHGVSGYFNCPRCSLMYDEPDFSEGSFMGTDDDDS